MLLLEQFGDVVEDELVQVVEGDGDHDEEDDGCSEQINLSPHIWLLQVNFWSHVVECS